MNSDFDPTKSEAFIAIARERELLDADRANALLKRSLDRRVMPSKLAVELGILLPVEVEIVEAFLEPKDLAPGYELLDVVGHGALGVVYRARQPHLHRDVAIKAILKSRLTQQNVAARFQQEGAVIGRLQHPNIVSAFDFGSHRDRLYLVMELVNGADLRKRLDSGPMPIEIGLSIIRQAAAGLANAHSHQIIHRDIKPGNLLLTEAPRGFDLPAGVPLVKIADFGLARFNANATVDEQDTRLTMTGSALGTPMYCAPEQLSGDEVDHRADIYALGATLFRVLTGEPPFASDSVTKIIAAKVTGQDPRFDLLPSDLPEEVRELLLDMMKPDAEDRISDYDRLLERIDSASRSLGVPTLVATSNTPTVTESLVSRDEGTVEPATSASEADRTTAPSRRWLRIAIPLLIIIGLAIAGVAAPRLFGPAPTAHLVPSGWESPLFDGQTMTGWTVRRGGWQTAEGVEGGYVLESSGGEVWTQMPEMPPVREGVETGFGFRIGANLLDAIEAEIQFAFPEGTKQKGERYVLSIRQDGARLGSKADTDAEWVTGGERVPLQKPADLGRVYYDLRIERHGKGWFAFVDEKYIGTLPVKDGQSDSDIVLTAKGRVHFEGPMAYQLSEPALTQE